MTTALVTAASGSAGRSFVEALLDKGFDAASRKPETLSFSRRVETRAYDADRETDSDTLFALRHYGGITTLRGHDTQSPILLNLA